MTDRMPGFNTLAIHAGAAPDAATGARATPIYQTTSFVFDDVDHAASLFGLQAFGNIYTRIGNPTNAVLEERVAALEGGTAALAVASGHAAEFLSFHALLQPGDEFVAARKLYGGSINQFNHSYKSFGWNVVWADPDNVRRHYIKTIDYTLEILSEYLARSAGDGLFIILGDHQPAAIVTGPQASRAVPVHIVSRDAALVQRFRLAGFSAGLRPGPEAAERPMSGFAPLLLSLLAQTR